MTKQDETDIICVKWDEKPYLLSDFREEGKIPLMNPEDWGFYQIYGMHAAYGADVLLYIGSSDEGGLKECPLDPIGKRIHKRARKHKWEQQYYTDSRVYVGRLDDELPKQSARRKKLAGDIRVAEALMIYYHQPACNGKHVYMLSEPKEMEDRQNLRIMNFGNHRQLQVELSVLHYREYCKNEVNNS